MRGRLKALPPGWDFWTSIASSRNGAPAPHAPPKRRTHMSDDRASESLAYYASHGHIPAPALHAAAFAGLPADIRALTRAVQGLVFHYFADEKIFGWRPPKDRLPEIDTRRVRAMLARLAALDPRPLAEARPPERRLVGCCRDFAVLLCAMARDRKSTRLNSSHLVISYAVFCLKKKKKRERYTSSSRHTNASY